MTTEHTWRTPDPSRSDGPLTRLRRDWYLTRLDWHLDGLVPGRERRRIVRSLREDIETERSERPLREVLAGLGSPATLARSSTAGDARARPQWAVGVIAGGAALLGWWLVFFAYSLGMLAVVERSGLGRARSDFLGIPVIAFAGDDGVGIGWTGGAAWVLLPLCLIAVAVLLGGRAWRLAPRRTHG